MGKRKNAENLQTLSHIATKGNDLRRTGTVAKRRQQKYSPEAKTVDAIEKSNIASSSRWSKKRLFCFVPNKMGTCRYRRQGYVAAEFFRFFFNKKAPPSLRGGNSERRRGGSLGWLVRLASVGEEDAGGNLPWSLLDCKPIRGTQQQSGCRVRGGSRLSCGYGTLS